MIGRRHIFASMVALLTLVAPLCAVAEDGEKGGDSEKWQYAKGLFRSQLEKPGENLNVGLHYWIELNRGGKSQRVSNKFAFRKGDKIQIHMKPNIDGYAYVVMRSSSEGESSVLFPDTARGDNPRVSRGIDYALPSSGESFEFDATPGIEKISLMLSRNPIADAQAYLAKPADQPVTIASAFTGSKDLVPSQVFVAYASPHDLVAPPVKAAPKKVSVTTKPATTSTVPDETSESKAPVKKSHRTIFKTATATPQHEHEAVQKTATESRSDEAGVTTVVKKSPDGVLFVNVDLDHKG